MSLSPNTMIDHYTIVAKLGAGGMGEVYRARDNRLDRQVAIKILPTNFANDADRLKRFELEAHATSALNHPNILTVYDIGSYNGSPYLVAELLEGEELRNHLNGTAISERKVVDYTQQIANGLAAAHDKGITHRDLKPENLFVTTDGRVKILDFGLAKLRPQRGDVISSEIATEKQITDPGVVMGTVGYMSPEQVRGHVADYRSDIFSFGSILYEMLSGQRAFQRDTSAETMTAILNEEPDALKDSNPNFSVALERIVRRCLEKKPEQRFQSAHDLAFALEALSTLSGSRSDRASSTNALTGGNRSIFNHASLAWILASLFLIGLLASLPFVISYFRRAQPEAQPVVRYDISAPVKSTLALVRWPAVALSADGSMLAFVAATDGVNRLYIRRRDETEPRLLPGTEGAAEPAFSPNGKWIAFMSDFAVKKTTIDGTVTTVMKVGDARGISWLDDDTLIIAPDPAGGLSRISANGGDPQVITKLDANKNERTHRWPEVLPNGKAVLFTVGLLDSPDSYERSNIEAVIVATGERRVVFQGASMARYVPTGHLIFARGGALHAVHFNPDTLAINGNPEIILQGVAGDVTTGATHFSTANDGTLAFVPGGPKANERQLAWADRSGNVQPISIEAAQYNDLRISPDGSRVALLVGSSGTGDVWVFDIVRATMTRLTYSVRNACPIWSADGKYVYYTEIQPTGESTKLMRKAADGSREAEIVTSLQNTSYLKALKPDGSAAILDYQMNTNSGDLVELALSPNAEPIRLVNTRFNEYAAALSPDGRWLAYQSNENGRPEIFVTDISATAGRYPISTDGGEEPRWSHDGHELYYRRGGSFMSVRIELGSTLHADAPKELFKGVFDLRSNSGVTYDVDPKITRFLMIRPLVDSSSASQVRVVVNWSNELRRAVPVK